MLCSRDTLQTYKRRRFGHICDGRRGEVETRSENHSVVSRQDNAVCSAMRLITDVECATRNHLASCMIDQSRRARENGNFEYLSILSSLEIGGSHAYQYGMVQRCLTDYCAQECGRDCPCSQRLTLSSQSYYTLASPPGHKVCLQRHF